MCGCVRCVLENAECCLKMVCEARDAGILGRCFTNLSRGVAHLANELSNDESLEYKSRSPEDQKLQENHEEAHTITRSFRTPLLLSHRQFGKRTEKQW